MNEVIKSHTNDKQFEFDNKINGSEVVAEDFSSDITANFSTQKIPENAYFWNYTYTKNPDCRNDGMDSLSSLSSYNRLMFGVR